MSATARAAEPWTIESALYYALRNNPEARLARHRITGAEAMLGQATAAFMPHVDLQSGYTRTNAFTEKDGEIGLLHNFGLRGGTLGSGSEASSV